MSSGRFYTSSLINLNNLSKAKNKFFESGEKALAFVSGQLENRSQLFVHYLILTDRRILIWVRDSLFNKDNHESIDYKAITSLKSGKKDGRAYIEFDDKGRFHRFILGWKKDVAQIEKRIHKKMKDIKQEEDKTTNNFESAQKIKKLEIIMKRTSTISTTELAALLDFTNITSLLSWLYTLPETWKFRVIGEMVDFNIKDVIHCIYCRSKLEEVEDCGPIVCMNCGRKTPICEICKNIIHAGEKLVQVSTCGHIFHKEHIVEWIKVRGKCPVCKEEINEDYLVAFVPSS